MTLKNKAEIICEKLYEMYPNASCSLNYTHDYELLIATRLSAQCTDKRVNIVTEELFKKYPDLTSFANANLSELEKIITPCGLFKTKAKSIIEMSNQLLETFEGRLPDTLEALTSLSGIGRKTANLIVGEIFLKPAIITDTHCIRISRRLGLTKNDEPKKVEFDLLKIIPPEKSVGYCHRMVTLGREICTARKAKCEECALFEICSKKL